MLVRLSAAICGATILLACSSVAMARSEVRAVHSSAVNRSHLAIRLLARLQCTIPIDLDIAKAAYRQPPASAIIHPLGPLRFKLLCVRSLRDSSRKQSQLCPGNKKAIVKINDV